MAKNNNSNKTKKTILTVSLFLMALAAAFFAWLFYVGSPKEITAVADQFKADSSWKLVSEHIQPPRTFCMDSVECPSLSRRWETPGTLSREELVTLLNESDWSLDLDNSCETEPKQNVSSRYILACSANGVVNNYKVHIKVGASSPEEKSWVSLGIEKD